jgi:hypothetical protein
VNVQRAAAHGGEERFRDLVAIRRPDEELRAQGEDRADLLVIKARGLPDREAERASRDLYRGLAQDAARRGPIGLRYDPDDLNDPALAETIECLERADGELRRAQEESALC